jgi:hypothetical protein
MRFFKGVSAKPNIRWSRIRKNLSKTEFGSSSIKNSNGNLEILARQLDC